MLWLLHTNDLWFIIIHLFDLFLPPSSLSLMDRTGNATALEGRFIRSNKRKCWSKSRQGLGISLLLHTGACVCVVSQCIGRPKYTWSVCARACMCVCACVCVLGYGGLPERFWTMPILYFILCVHVIGWNKKTQCAKESWWINHSIKQTSPGRSFCASNSQSH